jgi:hypothetical protein
MGISISAEKRGSVLGRVKSCHASRAFGKTRKTERDPGMKGFLRKFVRLEGGKMKFNEEADSCLFQSLWRRN